MSRTLRLGVVTALLIVYVALGLGAVFLGNPAEIGFTLPLTVAFLACPAVGAMIILRRPANRIGWLFCAMGLAFVVAMFAESYSFSAFNSGWVGLQQAAWMAQWVWLMFVLPGVLLFVVFPSGRLPSRRWILPVGAVVAGAAVVGIGQALGPSTLELQVVDLETGESVRRDVANPYRVSAALAPFFTGAADVANIALIGSTALFALGMVVRFRQASGVEREQLKWFVLATASIGILIPGSVFLPGPLADVGWIAALAAIGAGLPIAAGIAILRHRLYDIDVVIRRTLIYGVLVGVLGAVYVGLVLGLQALLSPFTANNGIAVAVSTLAVAALFGPVRRRVQRLVDRRFYRSRYDAQRTLTVFASRLRDEIDSASLSDELLRATRTTVQPSSASIWLRERGP